MSRIQVKTLNERVATAGIHMGGGRERRKLEPYEVVDIPDDLELPDGTNLLDALWNTGKIELTMDAVTRPLDYANEREAKLCSPTFKPRGPDEERDQQSALDAVTARLDKIAESDITADAAPVEKTIQPKRRSAKRAFARADRHDGEKNTS